LSTIERGVLRIASLDDKDVPRIRELMKKYEDHPMDLADATLVRVAERERLNVVFTLDRNDFGVYRMSRNRPFKLIP
jgi:predicted nucleic acid-binding protein